MDLNERALKLHEKHVGKIKIESKVEVRNNDDLSLAYSPGVAEPCKVIAENPEKVYDYTSKGNLVAVVSDGSAVLGLGDIGPLGAMPVMEGKGVLFKAFAGVDAFPLCLDTNDKDKIIETVKLLQPTFGGINLEDISAPRCFEIEEELKKITNIPIFHDDQHGTAIVTSAGLINSLKIVNKKMEDIKVVMNGAGAAAIAIGKLLLNLGVKNIVMCDSRGIIYEGRVEGMNKYKEQFAKTNVDNLKGDLVVAMKDSDVFIGVSKGNTVTVEMVQSMKKDPIIFAMANPIPEIMPDVAKAAGAKIVGTGRSDFPNQVNNVLVFPGIFRGALDVRATEITTEMKIAAAYAIANLINEDELNEEYVIPNPFDKRVASEVAVSVAKVAMETNIARVTRDLDEIRQRTINMSSI
ncbi:malate dehydrogenase (oxaloacetate-decarboxylating) [Desulfonispora thiosulfatigenes DSM 11270]|uniref:Malate dehydrogenase (Oxaloacetate-decarboxylating) n=1 Tax=Desulfonispora thiosulfatigenes DSM 11270 TaxID=656914 RepID=A0A1W1VGF1_DESTI|nr:malic enzyme-like NAD(P)-binding protein [Desulfonispora thiosulfatigenes]SMB92300.1 malate dehydrogenase (oxaloacetate-decarboxylating) [Desulfonispora thiosulfatigenes DSM 11270]